MQRVAATILKAFMDLRYDLRHTLDKELIKNKVKTQLTAEEIKTFNFTTKKFSENFYTWTEEKKVITSLSLTQKGYDIIYAYDPYQTETIIIEKVVTEFRNIPKTKKRKEPDNLSLTSLVYSIEKILNPKQIADNCIVSALKVLVQDNLIIIKDGEVRLTRKAFNFLYKIDD